MSKSGLQGVLERGDALMPTLPPLEQRISWMEAREWLVTAIEQTDLANRFEELLRAEKDPEPGSFDDGYKTACDIIGELVNMRYQTLKNDGVPDETIANDALTVIETLKAKLGLAEKRIAELEAKR